MEAPVDHGEWRDVKGYESLYLVSDRGIIWSNKSTRVLKTNETNNGYLTVELFREGKSRRLLVHRLVAGAFIKNPNGLPQVNHIDENKKNNSSTNLEWCTAKTNINHGTAPKRRVIAKRKYYIQLAIDMKTSQVGAGNRNAKPVVQLSRSGAFISEYATAIEASCKLNINPSHISETCRGYRRSAGGYLWKYRRRVE